MPELETANFGIISYCGESVFRFPRGLPGFEDCHKFVPLQNPETAPILFLQSLEVPALCFTALPVLVVDPEYRLEMVEQDLELLGFAPDHQPVIGEEVLCLAVLSLREPGPTANLLAPLVVSLRSYQAVQAVTPEAKYSHQHALFPQEVALCS